jgi:hypothetical protein
MALATSNQKVRFDLEGDDASIAEVSTRLDTADDVYVNNSITFFVSGEREEGLYINISRHTYTSVGELKATTHTEIMGTSFTMVEAEALLELLQRELAK